MCVVILLVLYEFTDVLKLFIESKLITAAVMVIVCCVMDVRHYGGIANGL